MAVPNGAPVDKPRGYPLDIHPRRIVTLKAENLANAFLVAVATNKHEKFTQLLERAKQLGLSEQAIQNLLTQPYKVGLAKRQETLLHLAAAHGNMPLVNPLLSYFVKHPDFPRLINSRGSTPAHIVAENNRKSVLEELRKRDIDLRIRNKKKETAYDVAVRKEFTRCLSYCTPEPSTLTDKEEASRERASSPGGFSHSSEFLYGGIRRQASNPFSFSSYEQGLAAPVLAPSSRPHPKTFRELSGLSMEPTDRSEKDVLSSTVKVDLLQRYFKNIEVLDKPEEAAAQEARNVEYRQSKPAAQLKASQG